MKKIEPLRIEDVDGRMLELRSTTYSKGSEFRLDMGGKVGDFTPAQVDQLIAWLVEFRRGDTPVKSGEVSKPANLTLTDPDEDDLKLQRETGGDRAFIYSDVDGVYLDLPMLRKLYAWTGGFIAHLSQHQDKVVPALKPGDEGGFKQGVVYTADGQAHILGVLDLGYCNFKYGDRIVTGATLAKLLGMTRQASSEEPTEVTEVELVEEPPKPPHKWSQIVVVNGRMVGVDLTEELQPKQLVGRVVSYEGAALPPACSWSFDEAWEGLINMLGLRCKLRIERDGSVRTIGHYTLEGK